MRSCFAIVMAVSLLAGARARAWTPSPEAERELRDGKPVSEVEPAADGAVQLYAAIDVPAPPKLVWMVMNDCNRASHLVVTVTSCKVTQADPAHGTDVRETVTRGNLIVPTLHNVVREELQPYSRIRFHKAGGDLKQEEGEWRLTPLPGGSGTRVIYENLVNAEIHAPASLVRAGMRRDVAKVMMNLKRECAVALSESPRTPGRAGA